MEGQEKSTSPDKALQRLDQVAQLLDNRFRIPGTQMRFGVDSLVGLIPYAGDVITFLISGLLIMIMARYGAGGKLALKMMGNIWLDGVVGTIPILGDLFDFRYRANLRNVQLLKEHYQEGKHAGSAWGILLMLLFVLLVLILLSVIIMWKVLAWIFS